ncbi:MAG: tetratricopeptide repeat-containing protein [Allosphingosinicella sp.]|uniref:tetratricopeptide repeat-containing protein n=1 Tax=Allosphingosinicella sp. TaxID=2823234 RepID=UPI003944C0AA
MTEPKGAPLAAIVAYARAGALDHAWRQFLLAGHGQRLDDPAALAVKGRLLKDRAVRAGGAERRRLYLEAARAYRASAAVRPASYPLINAATLSFLAEDRQAAADIAREVLAQIERSPDEPETPYWRGATRAEALLLLGRDGEAKAALGDAIAAAPRAWEDHAATLRQFALLLAARGEAADWLDPLRSPRSIHFAGHMSFHGDRDRPELERAVAEALEEERAGFAFGALAAGADLLVAEPVLARGAELHVVLPCGAEAFAAWSVDPWGPEWRRRFDAAMAAAETVRIVRPVGGRPGPRMIALADEIAMGAAAMNARRLASEAVQLLVRPPDETARGDGDAWRGSGRRRRLIAAAREEVTPGTPSEAPTESTGGDPMAIRAFGLDPIDDGFAARLDGLARRLDAVPGLRFAPHLDGDRVLAGFADPAAAAEAAARLQAACDDGTALRIGGHYGLAETVHDPFSDRRRLVGAAPQIAAAAAASTPPGSTCVTDDFAAALACAGSEGMETGFVGELEAADGGPPIALHALSARL